VHYPTDIIGGAIIGSMVGYIMALIFNKTVKMPELRTA
jgi:membrane-associated phospholipid phosphatase